MTLPLHSNAPQYKQTGYTDAKLPQPFSDSGARGFQYSFVETRPLFRAGAVKRNGAKINLE